MPRGVGDDDKRASDEAKHLFTRLAVSFKVSAAGEHNLTPEELVSVRKALKQIVANDAAKKSAYWGPRVADLALFV